MPAFTKIIVLYNFRHKKLSIRCPQLLRYKQPVPYEISRSTRREKKNIGLFVSRLSPNTRAGSIVSHIHKKTGMIVKCAPHPTRYDSYSSYCVHATPRQTNILMNPEMWPACWIDTEAILEVYLIGLLLV